MKRTAEKFMAICLAIVLAAGCITTTSTAASKGYQFKYKGVTVSMHGKAASLIKKAGKPVAKKAKKAAHTKDWTEHINIKILSFILIQNPARVQNM